MQRFFLFCRLTIFTILFLSFQVSVAQEEVDKVQTQSLELSGAVVSKGSVLWSPSESERIFVIGGEGAGGQALLSIKSLSIEENKVTGKSDGDSALSEPRAWAATVETDESIVLVGGVSDSATLSSVVKLNWSGDSIQEQTLPDLPIGIALAGVAILDQHLYVFGGTATWPNWNGQDDVWRLALESSDSAWENLGKYPGGGVIQPAVAQRFGEILVFGGWKSTTEIWSATNESWGYRSKPIDGTTRKGWRQLSSIPYSLAGQAVISTGQAHVAIVGGNTGKLADEKSADGILIYHGITDTWVEQGVTTEPLGSARATQYNSGHIVYSDNAATPVLQRVDFKGYGNRFGLVDYSVVILYFLFMVGIVWYFAGRQDSSEEYALGGRSVKWWAAGISIFATGTSSISFMAVPAISYAGNLVFLLPFLIIPPFLFFLNGWLVYPLLRRLDITSTYEYLQARFSSPLRVIASFQSVSFQIAGRMSVVMLLPSLAISAVTGIDVVTSVLIMGLLTTIGTTLGGFEAVVWMDVTQGLLMLFGMLLMTFLAISGLPDGFSDFLSISREYSKFDAAILGFDYTLPIIVFFLMSTFLQLFGAIGDQPIVQRVFATPKKDMKKIAGVVSLSTMVGTTVTIFTGLAIFAYFQSYPEVLDPTMRNDQIVPIYIVERLPTGIAGLIIAALFAASMSTLSSGMNSVATLVNKDFALRIKPSMTDRQQLILMKLTSALAGIIGTGIAVIMATLEITSMFETWNKLWALLGGGFIGMYLLGIFTRRANSIGAVSGAIASVFVTYFTESATDIHYLFLTPIAVTTCVVVGYLVSAITPSYDSGRLENLTVWNK